MARADRILATDKRPTLYSDIDNSFGIDPSTGDLLVLKNEDAVKQSMKNLVLYRIYGTPYSRIGSNITRALFELSDFSARSQAEDAITEVLTNYEKRVKVINVKVTTDPTSTKLIASIDFTLANFPGTSSLDVVLGPVR